MEEDCSLASMEREKMVQLLTIAPMVTSLFR